MTATLDKDAIEARKLELALQKAPLELQKLAAEADDLRARARASQKSGQLEWIKLLPAYGTVLVSVVLAYLAYQQFGAQQEREQKFKLSVEMVKLINQMNADNETDQLNAALALAFFGRESVLILVENLAIDRKEEVYRGIAKSLQQIVRQEKSATEVQQIVGTLRSSAGTFLDKEMHRREGPREHLIEGLVRAIGLVGGEASRQAKLSRDQRAELVHFLDAARRAVKESKLGAGPKRGIDQAIDEQMIALSAPKA